MTKKRVLLGRRSSFYGNWRIVRQSCTTCRMPFIFFWISRNVIKFSKQEKKKQIKLKTWSGLVNGDRRWTTASCNVN